MSWPLTFEEIRERRRITRRCRDCGRPLPRWPEVQGGEAHRCFPCAWMWRHGVEPPGWRAVA
jgi:hypothetical protein